MRLRLKNLITALSVVLCLFFMLLWPVSYYLADWEHYITLPQLRIGASNSNSVITPPRVRIGAFDGSIFFYNCKRPMNRAVWQPRRREAFDFAGIYYNCRRYQGIGYTDLWTFSFSFIYPVLLTTLLPSIRLLLLFRRRLRKLASRDVDANGAKPFP